MEPRGRRRLRRRRRHFTLYTTSQNPHVARLVLSAFIGIAPENKLRVIAPDVGGGFGSKIFIYAEETVCVWAAKKVGRPVKWTADRTEAFLTDAHGRDHSPTPSWRSTRTARSWAAGEDHRQSRRLSVDLLVLGADLSLRPLLSGQYNIPAIYAR
jgi:carbon-monoxide dehydrogenase large subunit